MRFHTDPPMNAQEGISIPTALQDRWKQDVRVNTNVGPRVNLETARVQQQSQDSERQGAGYKPGAGRYNLFPED